MMPIDRVAVHDRRGERAVQHAADSGLLDQRVGDQLEALGVELERQRLALRHGSAHLVGAGLELATDAVGLDRLLVAIPGHAFDTDRRDVAAEAPESLDQRHVDAGARRGERSGQAGRAGAHDEHIGLVDDIDLARGLGDGAERAAGGGSSHGVCIIARQHVSESVHSSFIFRSPVQPLSVNFDPYGDGVVHPSR